MVKKREGDLRQELINYFEHIKTIPPTPNLPHTSPSKFELPILCPNCAHSNPPDFAYCGKCGATLPSEKEETRIY